MSREILTSASGTGSVNLDVPAGRISGAQVVSGQGQVAVEALGDGACRFMVTGGATDGAVVLQWDEEAA